jgi:MFS family permease
MGVGRFAFTPILPMMQDDAGLTVAHGSWLASANYLGYLLGALSAIRLRIPPAAAVRAGLLVIALSTLAMGYEHRFAAWFVLRLLPGVASAWILVFVSAWALEQLAARGRPALGGFVYAGVGTGIFVAGLACLVLFALHATSRSAWLALGTISLCVTALLWNRVAVGTGSAIASDASAAAAQNGPIAGYWNLVLCYGAFGFGYIVPATFLPVMARQAMPDPALFGWAWPVFGLAAAVSTLLASWASRRIGQRGVWIAASCVMAAGVLVPAVAPGLAGTMIAALCVGGTFMVITMVGLQEARRLAGPRARALIAAMTSAFAAGQIAGPLIAGYFVASGSDFSYALTCAAIALLASAFALHRSRGQADAGQVREG